MLKMLKMLKKKNQQGFTLLELLVVISIIGILVAVGAAAFSTAQQSGRDARRRGDMKALQSAQEQYYAKNSVYAPVPSLSPEFIAIEPKDPKPSSAYSYSYGLSPITKYCVCAKLEQSGKGNASVPLLNGICSWSLTGDYFCVSNLQ